MFLKNEIITKREIHTNNLFLKDLIKKTKFEEEKIAQILETERKLHM